MKKFLRRIMKGEKGHGMDLVLVLLGVGGLIMAPLLGLMSTGLLAGQVYEKKTDELYAADAGVEDAVWKIQHQEQVPEVKYLYCGGGNNSYSYNVTDVNGKSVAVTITYLSDVTHAYSIESLATGNGSGTKIEAYITGTDMYNDYSGILNNVITSRCDYELGGPAEVDPPEGEEHGPEADYPGDWPTASLFADVYWPDAKDYPYGFDTLNVKDYAAGLGPLCRNGTLLIKNTGTAGMTVTLNGTVYVTGFTQLGMTDKNFTLDLNGNTIFVEDATGAAPEDDPCNPVENQYALKIGGKCTLAGSGCVIAVGNIEFKPNLNCSPDDYLLVLSIGGKTYMQPNGDFYGTLAGNSEVYIQNGDACWVDSSGTELNFPTLLQVGVGYGIVSWELSAP
jgi:hypothetical protein